MDHIQATRFSGGTDPATEPWAAAAARNRGIQAAPEARWFAFLDSDDVWPSDFLQRTLAALQVSPEAAAVTCDRRLIDVSEGREIHVGTAELAINPTRWLFVHGASDCLRHGVSSGTDSPIARF